MEPFFFATDYGRRAADGRELYKRLFDCAAQYGARVFVFHGDYKTTPYPFERYCESFADVYKRQGYNKSRTRLCAARELGGTFLPSGAGL